MIRESLEVARGVDNETGDGHALRYPSQIDKGPATPCLSHRGRFSCSCPVCAPSTPDRHPTDSGGHPFGPGSLTLHGNHGTLTTTKHRGPLTLRLPVPFRRVERLWEGVTSVGLMECAMPTVRPPSRGPSLCPPAEAVFLTVAQVCERMQLSRPSVVALITNGQLAAIKVGRHWRISATSVDRLSGGSDAGAD